MARDARNGAAQLKPQTSRIKHKPHAQTQAEVDFARGRTGMARRKDSDSIDRSRSQQRGGWGKRGHASNRKPTVSSRAEETRRLIPTEVEASVTIARCCSPPLAARRPRAWWDRGRKAAADEGEGPEGFLKGFSVSSLYRFSLFRFSLCFSPAAAEKVEKTRYLCGPARPGGSGSGLWTLEGSRQRPCSLFYSFI